MKVIGDGIEYNFIAPFIFLNTYYLFNAYIMCKFYLLDINVKCFLPFTCLLAVLIKCNVSF